MDFKAQRRHIAETHEQMCSKQFTVATTRIATVDAFTAAPASVPKLGRYDGRGGDHLAKDGGKGGHQRYAGGARRRPAQLISSWLE